MPFFQCASCRKSDSERSFLRTTRYLLTVILNVSLLSHISILTSLFAELSSNRLFDKHPLRLINKTHFTLMISDPPQSDSAASFFSVCFRLLIFIIAAFFSFELFCKDYIISLFLFVMHIAK